MSESATDSRLEQVLEAALLEDVGLGDVTSEAIFHDDAVRAADIVLGEKAVVAGLEAAGMVFRICDPEIEYFPLVSEGSHQPGGTNIASIKGSVKGILKGERLALNLLQRMSGIATLTAEFVRVVEGTRAMITDTRKTAPGLRAFDKWAVRIGGGVNHRFGLDDMMLVKDNHIDAAGGIGEAVRSCRRYLRERNITIPIEVEARNLDDVREILEAGGVHRIMLDNCSPGLVREAVVFIEGRCEIEASGGMSLTNVRSYAEAGVDFISVGALTHSVHAVDVSLSIHPARRPSDR